MNALDIQTDEVQWEFNLNADRARRLMRLLFDPTPDMDRAVA
ncbi:hypothetical protein AB0B89_18375 [Sphaerisporangium sp. NPDC049002]